MRANQLPIVYRFLSLLAVSCLFMQSTAAGWGAITQEGTQLLQRATLKQKLRNFIPHKPNPSNDKGRETRGAWWSEASLRQYRELSFAAAANRPGFEGLQASLNPHPYDGIDPLHLGPPIPGEVGFEAGETIYGGYFGQHESGGRWTGIATKSGGGTNPGTISIVNSANGNKLTAIPIVSWLSRGYSAISFVVFHNSQGIETGIESGGGSGLPQKWSHSYNIFVSCQEPGNSSVYAYLTWGDGLIIPFHFIGSNNGTYNYRGPSGVHASLTYGASGWTLYTKDQTIYHFEARDLSSVSTC